MAANPPLILASSSPRRLALLRQIGLEPDAIEGPEVDETPLPRELPRAHASRLAAAKAGRSPIRQPDGDRFVLGADTVVACGRRILPKATDADGRGALPEAALGPAPPGLYRGRDPGTGEAGARRAWS